MDRRTDEQTKQTVQHDKNDMWKKMGDGVVVVNDEDEDGPQNVTVGWGCVSYREEWDGNGGDVLV